MKKTGLGILLLAALTGSCKKNQKVKPRDYKAVIHKNLSDFRLFGNMNNHGGNLSPVSGSLAYELVSPLFSDYALKFRTIRLPGDEAAIYDEKNIFDLPVGTVITKTFAFPDDFRAPQKKIRLYETRLLIRQGDGWLALPYVWNDEQTEAILAPAGKTIPVAFVDTAGKTVRFNYTVPAKNQCGSCHQVYENGEQIIKPIGIKARHLNRDIDDAGVTKNQLAHWVSLKMLDAAGDPKIKSADYHDAALPVDKRARAYLDINCAHCHTSTGSAGIDSKLELDVYTTDKDKLGYCKIPGSAGKGGGGLKFDIVPGSPEKSILYYRTATDESGAMMPQIGRALVHKEGAQIIYDWLKGMPPENCSGS